MTQPTAAPRAGKAPMIAGLYRLLLHQQSTKGRLILAAVFGSVAIGLGLLISQDPELARLESTVEIITDFGLGLMVPILSLVLATSVFGQLTEDETLVYLWIRPFPRWILALAGWLAAITVALPVTVIPLTISAAIGAGDSGAIAGTALSTTLAALAYTGIFVFVGLLLRRSLIWGLVYVFIWEFFVARVGQGAARLSINTYPASVFSHMAGVEIELGERGFTVGIVVPLVVTVVGVALTAWRLNNANVA